jgi:hypothetical protein
MEVRKYRSIEAIQARCKEMALEAKKLKPSLPDLDSEFLANFGVLTVPVSGDKISQ